MEKTSKSKSFKVLAVFLPFLFMTFSIYASAHSVDTDASYDLIAGVGADGQAHEHAPVPVVASDGHTDHAHTPGDSGILKPGSGRWYGLLAVSTLITALLCYGVYRYIQVPPVITKKPVEVVETK